MVNWKQKKWTDLLWLLNGLVFAIVLNQLAAFTFFRIDLTEEKRYSIQLPTRDLLQSLDDDVYIEVFLEGNLNAGFTRLQKSIRETLEEFRVYSKNKIHYSFTDPATAMGKNAQREFMTSLTAKGIQPINVIDSKDGQRTEKIVFPGAIVSYGGMEKGVMLLRGNNAQRLNPSIEGLEFELANTISALVNEDRKRVGFVTGHGELDSIQSASLRSGLSELYDVESVRLSAGQQLSGFGVLVVAKPRARFTEQDKYAMDQYLMRGGRLLMLIDQLEAAADSASRENYFAFPYALGLDDQLFRYGVRVNPDLVQDRVSLRYPVVTGVVNDKPQITPIEWPFFPLINQYANHPATRNIDASVLKFASSVDTVKAVNVRKTLLLVTSAYSRKLKAPVKVSANDLRSGDVNASLNEGPIALGYLLEGKFTSVFKNRFLPVGVDSAAFKPDGVDSKVIVIGDGDIARNEVRLRTGQPQRLGLDPFSGYTFANQELLMNLVAYLADEKGLISARSKEVKVRPLDKEKVRSERVMWQVINVVMPVVLVVLLGILKFYNRKRKYTRFGAAA